MEARGISQVDAAVLKEAADREPFQQIATIASRPQSPTSATKSANSDIPLFSLPPISDRAEN